MTLRAWIIELRGRVREALAPDLAQLREELAQQRTRMNLMRIQLADQNLRISDLTRKGDTRRAEVEKPTTLRPASEWRDDDVPCEKCGKVALDTGLECDECGHDN